MSLKTDPLGCDVPNSEMSYGNFFIRYEHKFLRNVYSDSEIAESPQICTLQNHYVAYQKFIGICISLLTILGSHKAMKTILIQILKISYKKNIQK